MGQETLFSWVHLSDIHVGHGDRDKPHGWNQVLVMEALRRDIAGRPGPKRIDKILVTGDIAFSGDGLAPNEYTRAREWLLSVASAAGVAPASIFLVPGNHDVNRGVDRERPVARLMETLRAGTDPLDAALADSGDRALLTRRMAGYLDLAKDFAPWTGDATVAPEQRLFWMRQLQVAPALRVRLVGLNTALLAKDVDERKLQLGSEQLVTALIPPVADEGELVVVLSHHPLSNEWLSDAKEAHAWIRNHAHVHVSGHVHEAESGELRSGAGSQLVHVVAGAVHGERMPAGVPASHGYNYGEIVRGERGGLELRVWPRRWSEPNKEFRLDVDSAPDGQPFATHALKVRVAAPPARAADRPLHRWHDAGASAREVLTPAHEAPLPEGPLPLFISYAPEDAKAVERLRVHLKPLGPRREKLINAWSAAEISAGEDARRLKAERLRTARIVLLLISPDYLGSDDCYDVEMAEAIERHHHGAARVIPILLKPCDYEGTPFAGLRFARQPHHDAAPVAVYGSGDPETAFHEVEQDVRAAVLKLRSGQP